MVGAPETEQLGGESLREEWKISGSIEIWCGIHR